MFVVSQDQLFPIEYDEVFYTKTLSNGKCLTLLAFNKDETELLGVATARKKRAKTIADKCVY